MKKIHGFLALVLLLLSIETGAMDFYARKLNTSNGLPDNNVRNLSRDQKGFIWMGTPNGLYRYDGYFFTTYKYAPEGNLQLMSNNHVIGSYPLSDGRMLFRLRGGKSAVFDVAKNQFVNLPNEEKEKLYQQTREKKADNQLLAKFKAILNQGGNYFNDNLGNLVVIDQTGMLWLVDHKTGETIEMKVFDEKLFPLVSSHKYKVLTAESKGLVWVSTNGCGITVYNRHTHETQHIRQSSGLITTDYIQDICLDKDDNVWVADEFHGVVHLSMEPENGETRMLVPDSKELRSNQVYILRWMTDSTLFTSNTKGDIFRADANLNLTPLRTGFDVHAICTDKQGNIWVGSRQRGFRSPDNKWHGHDASDTSSASSNNVTALFCDRDGNIWMGCEDAMLDLIVPQTDGKPIVRHFLPAEISPKVIFQDSNGTIWVGSRMGLFSFTPKQLLKDNKAYRQNLKPETLVFSEVNCLYEDSRKCLWVGTGGDGIYYTKDHGHTFKHLTTADGLVSNEIQSIISADDKTLWIATKQGITIYQTNNGTCQYIYNEHNLQQNYYADNCACRLKDGRLAFGTNQGILIYDPQKANGSKRQPVLTITDLLINGEPIGMMGNDRPIQTAPDEISEVSLAHNQNTITIRFSSFNFASASTRYTYKLDGYDQEWSELSVYSFASYKNLPPGKYTLHIKAYDNQAVGAAERTLSIVVRHPWWQTWWAYLIYLLLAGVVAGIVYRQLRTVYKLRQRISIEQQLTEFKLQFFTNISHEFRTPLTIIRGAIDRISGTKDIPADLRQPISSMNKSTERMLRLINQLLEFRKMQNNKLRLALEEVDIISFLKDIYQNFSSVAQNKQMSYTFLPNVKSYTMFIDRQHVDKIVYNLLSNAFKYTPAKGMVIMRVNASDKGLTIRVEDSGVGIPKEKQPELFQRFMQSTFSSDSIGIGLHLTKALVDVHKGTISYEERQPQGAAFTVTLPTDKTIYAAGDFIQDSGLEKPNTKLQQPDYQEVMPEPMNDRMVLIVEDDADIATFLRQTLGRYFNTSLAMDGTYALEQMEANQELPDLIISDVMMPGIDGFELTRRIKGNPATQAIPIILLTALNSDDHRLKGSKSGADAYMTKPFNAALLVATCRQLIEQRDKLKQSFAEQPAPNVKQALPEIIVEERDRHLLDVMDVWLSDHLSDASLSVDDMAEAMGYRRSVFYKKVKALTGLTPADYIRTLRMNRAAEMLKEETISVAEVSYKVGISDPHYFTKVFKQQFGVSPKKYQQGKHSAS